MVSSAYVDEDGELVESSFYRSGATLRGVRMTQYFEDDPYDTWLFSNTAFNAVKAVKIWHLINIEKQ